MGRTYPATERLLGTDPFELSAANRQLFVDSFRETASQHYEGCPAFRAFWDDAGVKVRDLRTEDDLTRAPWFLITLLKEQSLLSVPEADIELTLTSSGTTGQKSQQRLDAPSLASVKALIRGVYGALGMVSPEETANYLMFTYDPRVARDLGTAFTDELISSFTRRGDIHYALTFREERRTYEFDEAGVVEALRRFAQDTRPLRILGFPAFLHKVVQGADLHLKLPEKSWVLLGGGWKNHAQEEMDKAQFREWLSSRLGIAPSAIRDSYGLVEHGVPYVDCEEGRLHIPNYARVYVRDPITLRCLPDGQVGLLQLMCSYNASYPCINVLTTDYGVIEPCACRIASPTLRLLGRAGLNQHKGCAIKALELLGGQ